MAEPKLKPNRQLYRFDQLATNVNERVEPGDADTEYYVGLEHLDSDSLKIRRWGKPEDVEATKLRFRQGDIIFGRRRVYQRKLAVADFDGICSAHAMVLRPKPEVVLPEFLPFFMQSDLFMNRALEISVGSLSPTINWRTLAAQEFPLPPPDEQRRLVEVLETFEKAINSYRSLEARATQLRKAIQENWLLDPESDGTSGTRIDEFVMVNPRDPALPSDAPFVPMEAVQEWNRQIERFEIKGSRGGVRARAGDILLARITPCLENGKTAQVPDSVERCGGSTEFIVLRAKPGISPDFVYWMATAPRVRKSAIGLMHGSTGRQRLAAPDFARLNVAVASQEKVNQAVESLNQIEKVYWDLLQRINEIKSFKKSFLALVLN